MGLQTDWLLNLRKMSDLPQKNYRMLLRLSLFRLLDAPCGRPLIWMSQVLKNVDPVDVYSGSDFVSEDVDCFK